MIILNLRNRVDVKRTALLSFLGSALVVAAAFALSSCTYV